jgi:hypothetical protein
MTVLAPSWARPLHIPNWRPGASFAGRVLCPAGAGLSGLAEFMRDWIEWFGWLLFLIAVVILFGWIVYLVGRQPQPASRAGGGASTQMGGATARLTSNRRQSGPS